MGQRLRAFGAISVDWTKGATREELVLAQARTSAALLIKARVSDYVRWVNFPWSVVEVGEQNKAGVWTAVDNARLKTQVPRAHAQGLWIRFYTLDGFAPDSGRGYTASDNFASEVAAQAR